MNGHRSNGPSFKPRLTICDAILTNKKWFADDASVLGDQFDGAKARERSKITVELLQRRARRHHRAGDAAVAIFGSYDLSWEDGEFYQGHWHIPMLTLNREKPTQRLKAIFPASDIVKRPVVVSRTYSDGYLPYKDKAIKLPDLLRRNRRGLPQLLLALDRTDPLELMVLMRLRVRAQNGELKFRQIR